MRPKDDLLLLGHMLDVARKISGRVSGLSRTAFDENEDLQLALAHLVQTVGEAARGVSEPGRLKHPSIPWREITGMRHKIVHDYMDVSFDVLWTVVTRDLPPLLEELEKIVPPDEPDPIV
jgi:uncharacterized protein with HEPN domain